MAQLLGQSDLGPALDVVHRDAALTVVVEELLDGHEGLWERGWEIVNVQVPLLRPVMIQTVLRDHSLHVCPLGSCLTVRSCFNLLEKLLFVHLEG